MSEYENKVRLEIEEIRHYKQEIRQQTFTFLKRYYHVYFQDPEPRGATIFTQTSLIRASVSEALWK
jgi:hypothetical protein